ncbi:MAG TPA: DUF4274 domain-containing protein [Caulobacteraceae bacterium]|nr:DUF4274 domain-containing protein [Caulobacteraceae bacterium]
MATALEDFVHRFQEQNPDNDDEIDLFLAWLQENGPDEWRRWASGWNWDQGIDLFEWIIAQANCDRGTALHIYYCARPEYFSKYVSVEDAKAPHYNQENLSLILKICEMWREGAYQTYAYRPGILEDEMRIGTLETTLAGASRVPWNVPTDLARPEIKGEPNEFERVIDGVPIQMLRALGEEW